MAGTKKTSKVAVKAPVKKPTASAVKKTVAKPAAVKTVKKSPEKKVEVAHVVSGLTATVVDIEGKAKSKMTLPAEVFAEKENEQLTAQAVRVYLANQRAGSAATKTRGMVTGSTRKIYKQKGTGRARHGNIRAPIFVGGGIIFGPVPHDFSMQFPDKMKRKALACALSTQYHAGNVVFVDGLETIKPKTKLVAASLSSMSDLKSILLVVTHEARELVRAARNIEGVTILPASNLNTYAVLVHKKIVFMKDAVATVKEIITK